MSNRIAQRVRAALVGYDQRQAGREARRAAIQARHNELFAGYGKWYYHNVTKVLKTKCKSTTA